MIIVCFEESDEIIGCYEGSLDVFEIEGYYWFIVFVNV